MLWWFAQTTLIAGGLALVAALAGRWKRLGPEARHALWLVVLIKLAIPPFVAWPWSLPDAWPSKVEPVAVAVERPEPSAVHAASTPSPEVEALPSPDPRPVLGPPPSPEEVLAASEASDEIRTPEIPELGAAEPAPMPEVRYPSPALPAPVPAISLPESSAWDWKSALLAAWLAGSLVVVVRRGVKVLRFHRGLAASSPAPGWLIEEARAVGIRVGVRPPPVLTIPRIATPLLWCLGRPRLLVPEALLKRLGADRWPGILAHELAHLARGDHWVVRLELLVEAAWWWNPLFWLARRRLHEEAEIACDARVVRSLPERRYAYAEALVDVCEHIARGSTPSPALGVGGAGSAHSLEGRLHMILRDPIPHRPTRRATLLALLLAALALPAWTLGQQQPEAPSSEPETKITQPKPQEPASKPDAAPEPPRPAAFSTPNVAQLTVDSIVDARSKAIADLGNLSFRYVVSGRDRYPNTSPEAVAKAMRGQGPGGSTTNGPVTVVRVQVADVTLDLKERSKLDVIEARPESRELPPPGGAPPRPLGWDRRFVATDGSGFMALATADDQDGPVPFRWVGSARQMTFGDSLASSFSGGTISTDPDQGIDPFDPRPANMLDFGAKLPRYLQPELAHAEVVGLETIDGREVVRVAWIANADIGLRGICWLAPDLRYAVVRSDATMDPSRPSYPFHGRRSWRRRSSDFVQVANLWLPRKVTYEESEAELVGGKFAYRMEREIVFEDYRVEPKLPTDTFRPRLAIQAIDDLSGHFTAKPPELPPGLVARLTRAVAEGKFGPPVVEKSAEGPKVVQPPPAASPKPAPAKPDEAAVMLPPPGFKTGEPLAPIYVANLFPPNGVANPNQPPPVLQPFQGYPPLVYPSENVQFGHANGPGRIDGNFAPVDDPAKIDPKIILPPPAGFHALTPIIDPPTNDPIQAKGPGYRFEVDRAIEGRFKSDPEAIDLARRLKQAQVKFEEADRIATRAGDPTEAIAKRKVDDLKVKWNELWDVKSRKLLDELGPELARARDEVEVLQARRDGKAADLLKAEAQRTLAKQILARNTSLKNKGPNFISNDEIIKGEGEFAVADAEVASKKAALAESDAYLNQAKRRLGEATAARPSPDPLADKAPRPTPAEEPGDIEQDGRDGVAIFQARRDGTAAELQKAEAHLERAKLDRQTDAKLVARQGISQDEFERSSINLKVAEADVARKKADLAESDVLLNQARRREGRLAPSTSPLAPNRARAPAGPASEPISEPEALAPKNDPGARLSLKLTGQKARFTGQSNEYKLQVTNSGTAPTGKVKVSASLPTQGGKLAALPPGAKFDAASRKLIWSIPRLEPGKEFVCSFLYESTTPGPYRAAAEASSGDLRAQDSMTTEVIGIAMLDLQLEQTARVIDVGKSTFYDIKIKNSGTKEATKLQIRGKLAGKLKVLKHFNVEKGEFRVNPETGEFTFPQIESLGAGQSITLSLEVQATEPGPAGCHVFLAYQGGIDEEGPNAQDVITTTVAAPTREPASK